MKKTLSLLMLSVCCALQVQAQLARGFYRVQNTYTDRYISLEDNNPSNYPITNSGTVNMSGIRTYKPGVKVTTSPSTIIFVYNVSGTQYDMEAQGASIHYITGGKTYVNLAVQSDGSYQAYGTYAKVNLYLKDDSDPDKTEAFLKPNSKSTKAMNWWAKPVNTDDEYIGILPDVEIGGKYYGSIYASFAFKLASSGMKAYVVTSAAGSGFNVQEITGDIPAATPVIIECSSNSPANNKIMPIESSASLGVTNKLYGVYCDRVEDRFVNAQFYDPTYFRTLGKSNGKLAFVKASSSDLTNGAYLKANKAYLYVDPTASDVLVLGGSTDPNPPSPEPEKEFTENGVKYTVGTENTIGVASVGTLEPGYYEVPQLVQHNGQYYTVTAIMEKAFENQQGLTSISLPASLRYILEKAFAGCTNLSYIYAFSEEPATVVGGADAFEGVDFDNCVLNVPLGSLEKYKAADGWSSFKKIEEIGGSGIREIKNETKTNDRWYSLDGRELKAQPTLKGIYIKNGKKVVIR